MSEKHTTNRAHTLRVRLSKAEAAAIQQAADAAGLSMSSWCRMVLRMRAATDLRAVGKDSGL